MDGNIPEICSMERKKYLDDILVYDEAIQSMIQVLSEDYSKSDYTSSTSMTSTTTTSAATSSSTIPNPDLLNLTSSTSIGRQRAQSYAEGSNSYKSSTPTGTILPRGENIYTGVWGGLDLHYHSSSQLNHDINTSSSIELIPSKFEQKQSPQVENLYDKLSSTGIPPKYLKSAGYNAEELRLHGYTASQLIGAGTVCSKYSL